MRGLREFAAQQAESVAEAQREQFATLTLNTAVELTAAALKRMRSRERRRAGARTARRDADPLPRSRRTCFRGAPGLHARVLGNRWTARGSPRPYWKYCPLRPRLPAAPQSRQERPNYNLPPHEQRRRSRRRPAAAGDSEADRPQDLQPLHRGPALEDACRVVSELNAAGKMATIDVLGEHIDEPEQARELVDEHDEVFDAIERIGLDSNVSIKLTALGLAIDPDLCLENAEEVVSTPRRATTSSASTWRSRRHDADARALPGATRPRVRQRRHRPPGPPPAHPARYPRIGRPEAERSPVQGDLPRAAADRVSGLPGGARQLRRRARLAARGRLVRRDRDPRRVADPAGPRARGRPGPRRLRVPDAARRAGLRGDRLVETGHRLRIYTPYGKQWREYSLRRLKENPKIAGYILADLLGVNGR